MPSRRLLLSVAGAATVLTGASTALAASPAAGPRDVTGQSRIVVSGMARFEILSPTLIRTEYSPTSAFEDLPTETAEGRQGLLTTPAPSGTVVTDSVATLSIATGKLTMTYVKGSTFAGGLTFTLAGSATPVALTWNACQQNPAPCTPPIGGVPNPPKSTDIGGYERELISTTVNGSDQFFPQSEGMLNTNGYYLLDDTSTALRTETAAGALPAVQVRPMNTGYQDGYFFGYGSDYAQGLKDLSDMTGPAPILPEWAFGPWFSDYHQYNAADYTGDLFPKLRATRTPIDGFVLDTNWKDPIDHWNSYQFNDKNTPNGAFPDPAAFLAWAKSYGLHTMLNIHPSIDESATDYPSGVTPKLDNPFGGCQFYRTNLPATCDVFDWSIPSQAQAFFGLQKTLLDTPGISSLWLDWCCDASNVNTVAGVTPDSLVADQYGQVMTSEGNRPFVLARVGSGIYPAAAGQLPSSETGDAVAPATGPWGAHRATIGFTGDATSDFSTLAYEASFEPGESSAIGLPYLSNDIGGYSGGHLADDLYVRWVQLGVFSSILRLHGKESERLPFQYADGSGADISGERFLRLREELVPYLYTLASQAHTSGLPLTRAMALAYPGDAKALAATDEWMLGDSLLVAPITTAGTTATRSLYLPAGKWWDFFTGESVTGPATITTPAEGFDRMPVYVKAGGIVPMAPYMDHVGHRAEDPLTLRVGPGAPGASSLYEDAGDGNAYLAGASSTTALNYTEPSAAGGQLVVGARNGNYAGAPTARAYAVQFLSSPRPSDVTVQGRIVPETADTSGSDATATVAAAPSGDSWSYDPSSRVITVLVASRPTDAPVTVAHDVSVAAAALPESPDAVFLVLAGIAVVGAAGTLRRYRRQRV